MAASATWLTTAILFCACVSLVAAQKKEWKLNVFYINDIKYDIFPVDGETNTTTASCFGETKAVGCSGGFSRLKSLVDSQIKPSNTLDNSTTSNIWLNAGHALGGKPFNYDVLKFDAGALMNNLSFDALALEPAVFKYGWEASATYKHHLDSGLVVASNVQHVNKSKLITLGGDCHVAVIGFVDKTTLDKMQVFGVETYDEITAIKDEIKVIQTAQKDKKILFVALGSSNVEMASQIAKISDLDLVIFSGGNFTGKDPDRENYFEVVTNGDKKTYIASIKKNLNTLDQRFLVGRVEISLTDLCKVNTTPAPVQNVLEYQTTAESPDEDINTFLKTEFFKLLNMDEVVSKSKVNLLPYNLECRLGECSLGNLIADAMVGKLNDLTPNVAWNQSVKLAVFPANLVNNRNLLNVTGGITPSNLYKFFSQDEFIYTVELNGKMMRKMFNLAIGMKKKQYKQMDQFLQVSEYLHVEYDFDHHKVYTIKTLEQSSSGDQNNNFNAIDLNDDKVNYTVAVPYSMLYASDTYDFLRTAKVSFYPATVSDALRHHVTRAGRGFLSLPPIATRIAENTHVDDICVSNTGEVVILTIVVLVVLLVVFLVGWKYLWPRYQLRRNSLTQLL